MTTPTPRQNTAGSRPAVPLPGRHLPGSAGAGEPADPDRIRAEVRDLLAELGSEPARAGASGEDAAGAELARRAHILDQAHEVLVRALATVDKI